MDIRAFFKTKEKPTNFSDAASASSTSTPAAVGRDEPPGTRGNVNVSSLVQADEIIDAYDERVKHFIILH